MEASGCLLGLNAKGKCTSAWLANFLKLRLQPYLFQDLTVKSSCHDQENCKKSNSKEMRKTKSMIVHI